MQLEVGTILEGKITSILKFGAFVDLGEGKSGMVHISEVASSYVSDIREYCAEGQTVKVKVINIADDGKISLSMKRADEKPRQQSGGKSQRPRRDSHSAQNSVSLKDKEEQKPQHYTQKKPQRPVKKEMFSPEDLEYAYEPKSQVTDADFEDMLSRFKMSSEDRMSGLKMADVKKRGRRK